MYVEGLEEMMHWSPPRRRLGQWWKAGSKFVRVSGGGDARILKSFLAKGLAINPPKDDVLGADYHRRITEKGREAVKAISPEQMQRIKEMVAKYI